MVTPCAGFVPTWAAMLIALIAGIVCYGAVQFRIGRAWDDSLDVWGVHGVGGLLGSLLVGVFAYASVDGFNGLLAGNAGQLDVQCAGAAIVATYTFVVTFVVLKVINLVGTAHVPDHVQLQGLDEDLHGEMAYDLT
ncbi:MAG TPA: hypothetical protein VIJ45_05870 [Coriobacteriia bacterium]